MTSNVSMLEREVYSEAEAARLLGVANSTLHYWLEGKTGRGGKRYKPVIRMEPKGGHPPVTWAEFIEAGLLRQYRRDLQVSMGELRTFIDDLRERFQVPYPLADRRPLASGRALVRLAQEAAKLPAELQLVTVADDQYLLLPAADAFLRRIDYVGDVAALWRPHSEPKSPIRIDPLLRFGRPSIKGVSTEVVWEHAEAGEGPEEIADAFGLSTRDVRWAMSYENARRAA
jgi:uncharacterized protein (DUF433 family)